VAGLILHPAKDGVTEFKGRVAGEIKRHPEVETLLVTRDNRAEVMNKVLTWLTEGVS